MFIVYEYIVSWGEHSYDPNDYVESSVYSYKLFTQEEFEERIEAVFLKWEKEENWDIGNRVTSGTYAIVEDLILMDKDFFLTKEAPSVNLSTWKGHV